MTPWGHWIQTGYTPFDIVYRNIAQNGSVGLWGRNAPDPRRHGTGECGFDLTGLGVSETSVPPHIQG